MADDRHDLKLRSCMTLFTTVNAAGTAFSQVLDQYYSGVPDPLTLAVVNRWR